MSEMTLNAGWSKDNVSDNQCVYTRSGHSAQLPSLVLFKRTPRTASGVTSKYQVKMVKAFDWSAINAGNTGPNSFIELNIRNTDAQVATTVKAMLTELGVLLQDTGFQNDAVDNLSLPIDG